MGQVSRQTAVLARSLVAFAFAVWFPLLVAWILLLISPASPAQPNETIRRILVISVGLAAALALACCVWMYRQSETSKGRLARRIAAAVRSGRLALILCIVLIECDILAIQLLRGIAPAITDPLILLLVCWTAVFVALMLTVHWLSFRHSLENVRNSLALLGLTTITLLFVALLFVVSNRLIGASGLYERLRGALDYRPLQFIDDGEAPLARAFWVEQSSTFVRWLPYSYWTVAPIDGAYINVDEAGIRHTPSFTDDPTAPRIYFFGGSTMWGEGARDAYTIPAQVAQLLADRGNPAHVANYAQSGYVSWQDLLLFQAQLALDNAPALAVFYHGFNDVYSAYLQGGAGLTLRENQRVSDVEMGRLLRSGQPVFLPFDTDTSDYDWRLVTSGSTTPRDIVNRWLANRRLVRAVAEEHGVDVFFVWQPALFAKGARTASEQHLLDDVERGQPGFIDLYRDVHSAVGDQLLSQSADDVIILTDLFSEVQGGIFTDRVHINEIGNRRIAEALVESIADALEAR